MNGLGKVFILIFLLYLVQQGEQAILSNMGLIIVLVISPGMVEKWSLNITLPSISLDFTDGYMRGGQRTLL